MHLVKIFTWSCTSSIQSSPLEESKVPRCKIKGGTCLGVMQVCLLPTLGAYLHDDDISPPSQVLSWLPERRDRC